MKETEYRELYEKYGITEGETLIREVTIENPLKPREKMQAYVYAGNVLKDGKGNQIADFTAEYSLPIETYDNMLMKYINELSKEERRQLARENETIEKQKEDIRKSIENSKNLIEEEINNGMKQSLNAGVNKEVARERKNNAVLYLAITLMSISILLNIAVFTGMIPVGRTDLQNTIDVVALNRNIAKGDLITSSDLDRVSIGLDEYNRIASTIAVDEQGQVQTQVTVLYNNADRIAGKYAAYDLKKGAYLTTRDFTSQKVLEERTEIEIEVDGKRISVPVENLLSGNTTIRVIALISSDVIGRQIALPLSEFVLADRSIQDILTANGQSILEAIAQNSGND